MCGYVLDSIIGQTYGNLEILCVNDGSTDNTAALLTDYSVRDSRISIINQVNQGQAIARNTGVAAAHGDYIVFVDGDDYIAPQYVERLVEAELSHPDCMAITSFADVVITMPEDAVAKKESNKKNAWRTITIDELLYRDFVSSCWGRIAPISLFREHPLSQRYYEDVAIGAEYLGGCKGNIFYLDEQLYYHVRRQGSTVNASNVLVEQIEDYMRALQKQTRELGALGASENAVRYMRALHLTRIYRTALRSDPADEDIVRIKEECLREVKANLAVLMRDPLIPHWNKVRFFVFSHIPRVYNSAFNLFISVCQRRSTAGRVRTRRLSR